MPEQTTGERCNETCKVYSSNQRCLVKPEYPIDVRYNDLCYLTTRSEDINKDRLLHKQTSPSCTKWPAKGAPFDEPLEEAPPKSIEPELCSCGGIETVVSSPIDTVETCKSCGGIKNT